MKAAHFRRENHVRFFSGNEVDNKIMTKVPV